MATKITTVEQAKQAGAYDAAHGAGSYTNSNGGTNNVTGVTLNAQGVPTINYANGGQVISNTPISPEQQKTYAGLISGGASDTPPGEAPPTTPASNVTNPPATTKPSQTNPSQTGMVSYEQAKNNLATGGLQGADLASAQADLKKHYQNFVDANAGKEAPVSGGAARSALTDYASSQPTQPQDNPLSPVAQTAVATDPYVQALTEAYKQANDYQISQPTLVQQYQDLLNSSGIQGIDAQLLDLNKVIEGTQDDIRTEVTKAGGFATDSQVQALAAMRDKPLITKYNSLVALRAQQKDYLDTSIQLAEKDQTAINDRMNRSLDLATKIAEHGDKMQAAAKENYQFAIEHGGYTAFAQSIIGDPKIQKNAEAILGLAPGSLSNPKFLKQADAELTSKLQSAALDMQYKKAQISDIYQKQQADTPGTTQYNKNQDKLEQQYRAVLLKEVSNRSGGLGLQDQKVNQAIHLKALADSYSDGKGNYNIPKAQYAELAIGLANLISPTGSTAESDRREIMSKTASGDIKGAIQFITGTPQNGNSQAIIKNLVDSIDRQGAVSEDLRNQAVSFLHGLAPTGLDQSRIDTLEKGSLSSYTNYKTSQPAPQKLLSPQEIPSGYYQASDGLLYKK